MTEFEKQVEQGLFAALDAAGANTPANLRSAQILAPRVAAAIEAAVEASLYESKADAGKHAGLVALRGETT